MKKLLLATIAIGIVISASSAMATMFKLDSYTVNYRNVDPGLVLYANNILGSSASFDLAVDNSTTFDLFRIGTNENSVKWFEDTVAYGISVDFDFSLPANVDQTLTGISAGVWRLFRDDLGTITWNNPATFSFNDGGLFTVSLSNVRFGTPGSAIVQATVNFVSDSNSAPAPVPEPATMLLVGLGLAGLVGYNNRKRFMKKA